MRALDIATDAYRRMNRLSPGETLEADDAARAFEILNLIVDELSATNVFLYKSLTVSAVQSGNITLGTGSWATVTPGARIIALYVDDIEAETITMQQYDGLIQSSTTGYPRFFAYDGMASISLFPVPTSQTVKILVGIGVAAFADQTTDYAAPPGYKSAMGAMLAVRCAPSVIGKLPPELLREEARARISIIKPKAPILNITSYNRTGFRWRKLIL